MSCKFEVLCRFPSLSWRTHWLKYYGNNNKDEDNSPKNLNDENHQASSQKFKELIYDKHFFYSCCFVGCCLHTPVDPLHIDEQRQDDQLEPTYSSSMLIRDVALLEAMDDREGWQEKGQGYLC